MHENDLEIKCLKEKIDYLEQFQKGKISSFERKSKQIKNVVNYSIATIVVSIILIIMIMKLSQLVPLIADVIVPFSLPLIILIIICIICIPVFYIKWRLYNTIERGGNLLSQINQNADELCRLKTRLNNLENEELFNNVSQNEYKIK